MAKVNFWRIDGFAVRPDLDKPGFFDNAPNHQVGFWGMYGWDFDYEALGQFGSFGSANIRAWTVASETGYRFPTVPLKPRFSAKVDISSGDDPRTNTLGTFNPLFPKGNYFGVLATAGPGPINFIDVHPHVETALPHSVTA